MTRRKQKKPFAATVLVALTFLLNLSSCDKVSLIQNATMHNNRLAKEKSPYLLQHAGNPVDWFAWGSEAFEKAKKEDKPIFLSIGYSTCHWCHVMERESFESEEIAKILNDHFVAIKVDREERPDVDQIYMSAVMAMTGQGGWPLSVFITSEGKPFYGGTYFPPDDRWGRPGFGSLLLSIHTAWQSKREEILGSAKELTDVIRNMRKAPSDSGTLDQLVLKKAFEQLHSSYDSRFAGFGQEPKFPRSHLLSLLLRYWKRTGSEDALRMTEHTLAEMAKGGMYDQLGGGFHRYSTDAYWHIPHFEKMLYDQALLTRTYLEAYQATRNPLYADVARDIFEYVLRDLTDKDGGFYCAEDADSLPPDALANQSEKKEGAFYLWSDVEIKNLLDPESAKAFIYRFGIEPAGNARSDPQGEFKGLNTLYQAHTVKETAQYLNWSTEKTESVLGLAKKKLFDVRLKRPRPHLDDKVLTDWNGLMISSFAFGSRVLREPRYREAAEKAAKFILSKVSTNNGRMLHRYRDGESGIEAKLEDYVFFAHGLLDLYEATFNPTYLKEAKRLIDISIELFWDEEDGGFFMTPKDGEKLIARPKELYDGALPSGNSFALLSLARLNRFTTDKVYDEYAEKMITRFSNEIMESPTAYPQFLIGYDFALGPSREITLAGTEGSESILEMVDAVYARFMPNQILAFRPSSSSAARDIIRIMPFLENQQAVNGNATAFVCENYVCKLPTTDIKEFISILEAKG